MAGTDHRHVEEPARDLLPDGYGRLPHLVRSAVEGLTPQDLRWTPGPTANPIGWLVWHLSRVQNSHIAQLPDSQQVYLSGPWPARFGLEPDPHDTGYEHTIEQVNAVRPETAQALVEYYDAVHKRTLRLLRDTSETDLDRVVDERWNPPVTLGVRLISVLDDVQHAGQAASSAVYRVAASGHGVDVPGTAMGSATCRCRRFRRHGTCSAHGSVNVAAAATPPRSPRM